MEERFYREWAFDRGARTVEGEKAFMGSAFPRERDMVCRVCSDAGLG